MKSYFLLIFSKYVEAKSSAYKIAKQECREELGEVTADMDREDIIKLENCHMACAMKKLGTMTQNGEYNVEYVLEQIDPEDEFYKYFSLKLKECAAMPLGEDECDTAAEIWDCIDKMWAPNEWQHTLNNYKFMYNDESAK